MTKQDPGLRPLTGVIGWPVAHSKSPLMHNYWIKRHGGRGIYAPFELEPERVGAFLSLAPMMGVRGLNVTTPHKTAAAAACRRLTERGARAGAVNTLSWSDEEGGWIGDATDGFGFLENLSAAADWEPLGRSVLLIGAGGAAAAVALALVDAGVDALWIANRTEARAENLAERAGGPATAIGWSTQMAKARDADLIVNATSLGLLGGDDGAIWSELALRDGAIAADLTYAPLDTPFLQAARACGAVTVDGLGMLLHQARPGFEAWHGVAPVVDAALRDLILGRSGYLP